VAENDELRAASCDLCGDQGPLLLKSRCHLTAPLQAVLEGETLILSCYLPECGKEVARFQVARAPLTEQEIDAILGRWDQTAPSLQRKIMAETSMRLFKAKRALAEAQHALADARPPLTRERIAEAVGELFKTHNGASSGRVMELLRDDRLTIRQFTPSVMTDELCRLLGVEDE
jgi:hypothetical protein